MAHEDVNIRLKVSLDAGNAISEAQKTAASLRDVAKAGGEVALAAKNVAAHESVIGGKQPALIEKSNIIHTAQESAIGRTPAQHDKPAPDTVRVVQESAISRAPAQHDKPAPNIADRVRALEDALSSIESAKRQSIDRGDPSSARRYEQLYVSTNQQYRSEMGDYEKKSTHFEKIKADFDAAEQARTIAYTAESKASDEKSLKDKEYNDAAATLKMARAEAKRTDKISAEESNKDPNSDKAKISAKVAKSAEKNATQAEQAAEKASLAAKAAEEKYTEAKQKSAKATQDAATKQAALEKAAGQQRTDASERALRLGKIAEDAHAGQKAIGTKAREEEGEAHQSQLTRTMLGISKAINRSSGYIGQAGSGNVAGAALGAAGDIASILSSLGTVGAVGAALVGLAAAGNKLSEQWEKVMQPSMALTASLGELGNDARRNSLAFKDAFSRATDSSVLHGYTNEEGIALANQMAKLGVDGADDVFHAEERVFRWQRETDADRGTLAQAVGMASRYRGGEDVLGYVAGGLKESGMRSGQYQEYLNATLRIFEEGLSRGVVKGFDQITRTQNMLSQIGITWQGEQGAEKYQRMEDAVTRASDLQGDYDVILYKAAQSLMEQGKEKGNSGNYIDVAKVLDKGLTSDLLNAALGTMSQNAGGDTQSTILQIMKGFNLSATSAEEVYKFWKQGEMTQAKARIEGTKSNGADSVEKHLLSNIESIKADVSLIGSEFTPLKDGVLSGLDKISSLMGGDTKKEIAAHDVAVAIEAIGGVGGARHTEAMAAALQKDAVGSGGYADNVVAITNALAGVEPGIQNKIEHDPRLKRYLFRGLDKSEDYTDEAVERFRQELGAITAPTSVSPQSVGFMGFGQEWNTAATRTGNAASQQYAASVWDRYGTLSEYKNSQEYKDMAGELGKRKKDGLTEDEINAAMDIVIGKYKDRLEAGLGGIEFYSRNLSSYADPYDKGYSTLQSSLKSASELPGISEVIITKVNEAIEATTSRSSSRGAVIDAGEITRLIEAIHDLIPALKENAEFTVEGP